MTQFSIPTAPTVHTTLYNDLKGCDFSNDPSQVWKKRSPTCVNMISNEGGNPQKRTGWKTEITQEEFKAVYATENKIEVKNLYSFELGGKSHLVIFTNVAVFSLVDGTLRYLTNLSGAVEEPYRGFFFESSNGDAGFYFFGGEKLWVYKASNGGFSIEAVVPYIPLIRIWTSPNGTGSTGTSSHVDDINLLGRRVKEQYIGDSTSLNYYTSFPISTSEVIVRAKTNGVWSTLTTGYSVDRATQCIKFTSVKVPVPENEPNIEIEYAMDSRPDNVVNFFKCNTLAIYGNGIIDSVFVTGCEDSNFSSYVWHCKAGDPTYWPDMNYILAGSNDTKVMGLIKIGEYLGVVKEGTDTDSTIYLVYPTTYDEATTYATRQSVTGIGALSKRCFCTLGDEPLFLSSAGICGIASTDIEAEKAIKNRSFYINKKLLSEENLSSAVATSWNGFYILCVNDHCYILDSKQKSSWQTEWTNYLYEAFYWENVPASCMIEHEDHLWFGSRNGAVCRFMSSREPQAYLDDGKSIYCEWSTALDNDGATQLFKTMIKKGCLCTIQPLFKTSVEVYISVDGQEREYIGSTNMDVFTFADIDFGRFTFSADTTPKEFYFNKKKKKYKRMQIILVNDKPNESFGIYEIVKLYTVGGYSKNRGVVDGIKP